jgi:hypothetical protein
MKLLDSFHAVVPDVIEIMMRESGMSRNGMTATAIRAQVNNYLSSISRSAHALTAKEAETVRVMMITLVAAARERQIVISRPMGH